jgi:DNA-binding LytR/AlgR family response regulator
MRLSAIIVDDEPDAHKLLLYYCHKHGGIDIKGQFYEAVTALSFLENTAVDLVFLDINMPAMSGLQMASLLKGNIRLIFTTAYGQHALEGYEYNTVDYLLKPIKYERFERAVAKAGASPMDIMPPSPTLVLSGSEQPVSPSDICYAESMGNYIKLHLTAKRVVVIHETMKNLEQLLKPVGFLRCHKTYLVQLAQVAKIENGCCLLQNGTHIPIGISYRQQARAALGI